MHQFPVSACYQHQSTNAMAMVTSAEILLLITDLDFIALDPPNIYH